MGLHWVVTALLVAGLGGLLVKGAQCVQGMTLSPGGRLVAFGSGLALVVGLALARREPRFE